MKNIVASLVAALSIVQVAVGQAVLPGYLTDPSAMKEALAKDTGYQPPERLKYPYVSTYYVRPTVKAGDAVKVSFFVTDFESSKIRLLDDSHRFTGFLEYRLKGGDSTVLTLGNLKSGDAEFDLGKLPVGNYEMRLWAVDAQGRESHRVIHDFRVKDAADLAIPADKVYTMTEADLAAYGIRNDGDLERIVYTGSNSTQVVKEKRADAPGYTVTVPLDPKTGKLPRQAFKKATVVYDAGYDRTLVESNAVLTAKGLQRLLDDKATNGFRKVVMLPGTYRISHVVTIRIPDHLTLDLGTATLKQNAFTGESSLLVGLSSVTDAHLVGGTLEGDYWTHNYAGSPKNSEWPAGFELGGDCWYCTVNGVKVVDITGYGGQNGIHRDAKGDLAFTYESIPSFAPGGLDRKTGEVDATDTYRFTTDFKDLKNILAKGLRRIQVSKFLGYQGRATRSWQVTVAWYDAAKKFLEAETAWQYREMWIPEKAAFLRISVEEESVEAANKSALHLTAMRLPVNCAVVRCTFDHCRCVGYAASAMKNMLFAGNFFTLSGECAACCAFDAEDGWDQMQDVFFYRNVFRDNPCNNSILTCAGHNFILEKNDCDIYFWGRTHSPCVRDNDVGQATYRCDSRLRSGYGRFERNRYSKGVILGQNEGKGRTDNWDYVLSGLTFDGKENAFDLDVGLAGRVVNCTFRNATTLIANAFACTFENCTDGGTYKGYPSGRWLDVTVKNSNFRHMSGSYDWERCHFTDTKFHDFYGGRFTAKDCDFTNSALYGFDRATIQMSDCRFESSILSGGYWQKPSEFVFKDCSVRTRDDAALLKVGVYGIGKIVFDGCEVSGKNSLIDIFDLRPIQRPPNSDPADNPDNTPGLISLRKLDWKSEAAEVVKHDKGNKNWLSSKKISVLDNGGTSLRGGVVYIDDTVPATWEQK